jgi:long-chain acyl-CoA synthetase
MSAATLPQLLHRNAVRMRMAPAFRLKHHGIWQTLSWAGFAELVAEFAAGLAANGVGRGARVAVLGENRPRLYAALLAAQSLGGAGVPLHPDAEGDELALVLRDAGAAVVMVQAIEQAERVRSIMPALPSLRMVICDDVRGLRGQDSWLRAFDAVMAEGRAFAAEHPGFFADTVNRGDPDSAALLLYPRDGRRASLLSHRQLLAAAAGVAEREVVRPRDDAFCYLPMNEIGDAVYSLALALLIGFACNCPDAPHTVLRDLREIGPNILLAPPRIWISLARLQEARGSAATPLKRRAFGWFRRIAEEVELRREAGVAIAPVLRLARWVGEVGVGRPLRDQLGLSRLRWAHTGGEPLPTDIERQFRALGIDLRRDGLLLSGVGALHQPKVTAHA